MAKNIVIIGAGYAGILTAKKLAKRLRKNEEVKITLIDKRPYHTMLTELHEVAAARVEEDSIKVSLKRVFAGRKVDVKLDEIQSIDYDNKKAIGKSSEYDYDILVLAAGSQPTYFGVQGAAEYSHKLWSYDDAVQLKEHIINCFRKAASETDPEEIKRLLNFYVVGAGFTGTEMAGELAEYVPSLCDRYEIDCSDVKISIVDILPRAVPTLTEKLSAKIERRLSKMGINICLKTGVVSIGEGHIEVDCEGTKRRDETRTVIWAAGTESATISAKIAQKLPSGGRGRIQTDPMLRSTGDESIYIVGDNMLYIPEGEKAPVPQLVENCEQSSEIAAHNIICAVTGKGEMKPYKPSLHGVMVSVGGRYGVAYVGTANRKISLPSFFAMFVKHFINIIYFVQLLGWNKVFSYLKHEFFTVRNDRSFVGGHFSNKIPNFFAVPLRVWLGAVWLFEGVLKIAEGWFQKPMLTGFFGGANAWYDAIIKGTASAISAATTAAAGAASQAADAVTAATGAAGGAAGGAATSAGQVLINFDFLGLFRVLFVTGKSLSTATLSDYAFKLDVPLMNWFVNSFILPSDPVQMAMQIFIVLAEILIGLSLIGGLFTTPSSTFSLILQFMFVCTTGLYLGTFWMIFAAIAVLIGSGRVFGLDYYVMPYLKKKWKKLPLVRKSYLYHD